MYTATIGLEVHAELKTQSKMFCGCKNNPHHTEPNTNICPVCTGQPGTLPVPNQQAIQHVLLFGVAVNATLANFTEFDRKNYFYPDIPKAYQISQYAFPLLSGGNLGGVMLTRVHLEEDTARSQHDKGDYSLVDFNRAGVPLMELVTEPVIHSALEAGNFARELQLLLRTLGISEANMEKGEMRVEANISVSNSGQLGTKVEVKNLNSFKAVEQAIDYEIRRHTDVLEKGGTLIQETRGWDEQKQATYIQRKKETAKDYRYFPDPDIPKFKLNEIADFNKSRLSEIMPELPKEKLLKYKNIGLTSQIAEQIIQSEFTTKYLDSALALNSQTSLNVPLFVNYLLTDLSPLVPISTTMNEVIPVEEFCVIINLLAEKKITSRVAKDLITEFALQSDVVVMTVLKDRALLSNLSVQELEQIIQGIVDENPTQVADYKAGKDAIMQYFIGLVMKETKGKAQPDRVNEIFKKLLS
jgi:aspartyl-tRNA(Asn)/glutamyl-tRNA(Gln) amidotransferase subunit B